MGLLRIGFLAAVLAVLGASLEYPEVKRGGSACLCMGSGIESASSCTPSIIRNRPYDGTQLSSFFEDIPQWSTSLTVLPVPTFRSGGVLPRVVLELVPEAEQVEAEAAGSDGDGSTASLGVNVFSRLSSEVRIQSVSVYGLSDTNVGVSVTCTPSTGANGRVIVDDLVVTATAGLAIWDSVTVILNVSVMVDDRVTTGPGVLWLLLPAMDIRLSEAIGNSSYMYVPTILRFPFAGSPVVQERGPISQLFSIDSVVLGVPLGVITVYVTDIFGQLTEAKDGSTMEAVAQLPTGVGVSTVRGNLRSVVSGGVATFAGIVFDTSTPPRTALQLVFTIPGDSSVSTLISPSLVTLPVATFGASLEFTDPIFVETLGPMVQPAGSVIPAIKVAVGATLPPMHIRVLDSSGMTDTNTPDGLFLVATSREVALDEWSARSPVVGGKASFEGIIATGLLNDRSEHADTVLSFVLTDVQAPYESRASTRKVLRSPVIRVSLGASAGGSKLEFVKNPGPNVFARTGAHTYLLISEDTVVPSFEVRVLMESGAIAFDASGTVIVEVGGGSPGKLVVGAGGSAPLTDGRATFSELRLRTSGAPCLRNNFTLCGAASLTFRVVGVLGIAPLTSPTFRLLAKNETVHQTGMRFEPYAGSLLASEGTELFATARTPLLPIAIEILKSDGDVDSRCDNVTVYASTGGLAIEGGTAVSYRGRAVFSELLFAEGGTDVLTFSATTQHGVLTLQSGTVVVEASRVIEYGLSFHPESSVNLHQSLLVASDTTLPPIGILLLNSDHTVCSTSDRVVIRAQSTRLFSNGSVTEVPVVEGVAWFRDLIFHGARTWDFAQITFQAFVNFVGADPEIVSSVAVVDGMSYVHRKALRTGEIIFVEGGRLVGLMLVPYFESTGEQLRLTDAATESTVDRVGSTLDVFDQGHGTTIIEIAVSFQNGAWRTTLPRANTTIHLTCASNPLVPGAEANLGPDTRPSSFPANTKATFKSLQFERTPYISGYYTSLTFQAATPDVVSPLYAGPIYFWGSDPVGVVDEPLLLVEVFLSGASFSIDAWTGSLGELMNIPKSRIEVLRVRQGASASSGFDRAWSGTRIEMRFLSPTTATPLKVTSRELTENFLRLSANDCGVVSPLRIRRKLLLEDDDQCDLFVLDEQRRAAQRCVETHGPANRCPCHEPMFAAIGERCKSTDQMLSVCATLNRCGEYRAISDPCFELTYMIYLEYFLIGLYTFVGLLVLYLVYLWRSGAFDRCRRRQLGDASERKGPSMYFEDDDMRYQHMDVLM